MRATSTLLALAALALPFAAPLAAQEATEEQPPAVETPNAATTPEAGTATDTPAEAAPEPAAEDEAATDGTTAGADLSLGEPVAGDAAAAGADAEPQVGQPYIREAFGAWAQRCIKSEEGQPDPCQLYQLLSDADGNAVAEISMFPLPAGGEAAAGATIVTPLETLLTESLTLSVDGTATRRYPFTFCNAAGCIARVGFTAEEIQQFKNGDQATLRIVPAAAPDQEVTLTISLSGFTAGFDAQQTPPAE